jgi:hypothetical protein
MKQILQKSSYTLSIIDTILLYNNKSRDSSVRIAMGYRLDGWGSSPHKGRNFSLLHSFQTGPGAHITSFSIGTGGGGGEGFSQVVKRQGRESDHSPPTIAEVKYGGAIPPLSTASSWRSV